MATKDAAGGTNEEQFHFLVLLLASALQGIDYHDTVSRRFNDGLTLPACLPACLPAARMHVSAALLRS